ncbi:MAG: hypothetical protein FWD87_08355 [Spirochaetaceae bacterium]|nr:hypothetical protein [Spirochaetaceae bacterium]
MKKNLSLVILISAIIYIPVFLCKKKKHSVLKYFIITILLSLLFSATAIFFPYKSHPSSFEIEANRFYTSQRNTLFVNSAQDNTLSGIIINKNNFSVTSAETFSGPYSISEDMILTLQDNADRYVVEPPNQYHRFFSFFIRISSFIAESIGKNQNSNLRDIFIKSFAIIVTISAISFFFSTGRLPIVNYFFSQTLVICFIWFNHFIQRIPLPGFLQGVENLIPFDSGLYYFAYIMVSFSILLMKILSLRAHR